MLFLLSINYVIFFFSKNLLNKSLFFFNIYLVISFYFLFLNRNIFVFLLLLVNASAILMFIVFIILSINLKKLKKTKNFFFFFFKFLFILNSQNFLNFKKNLFIDNILELNNNLVYSVKNIESLGYLMYYYYYFWTILLSVFLTFILIICLNLLIKNK